MAKKPYIIVWDLETDSLNHKTGHVVQIASLCIDPYLLEIIPESKFESLVKPVGIFTGTEAEIQSKWNACSGAWEVNKKTRKELEKAPLPEHVWKAFAAHVKKYHAGGWAGKPIPAGHNIQGFDLLWADVLSERYKTGQLFNTRTILDTLNFCYIWFEGLPEKDRPPDYKMDTLRKYFGINEIGHDAYVDVKTCAQILIRFLKLSRNFAPKVHFKNSFKEVEVI
jgi:DNA polymerase III epsilon subunit-like protein